VVPVLCDSRQGRGEKGRRKNKPKERGKWFVYFVNIFTAKAPNDSVIVNETAHVDFFQVMTIVFLWLYRLRVFFS